MLSKLLVREYNGESQNFLRHCSTANCFSIITALVVSCLVAIRGLFGQEKHARRLNAKRILHEAPLVRRKTKPSVQLCDTHVTTSDLSTCNNDEHRERSSMSSQREIFPLEEMRVSYDEETVQERGQTCVV